MSTPGNPTVSREDYRAYIQSPAWRKTRKRFFASKLDKSCYVCGDTEKPKDLHHRTYKNLGNERLMDLVPACRGCHQGIHDLQKEAGIDIWSATKEAKNNKKGKGKITGTNYWIKCRNRTVERNRIDLSEEKLSEIAVKVNEDRRTKALKRLGR